MTLAGLLGPATSEVIRLLPDLEPRLVEVGAPVAGDGPTAPERRQARTLEGILGLLGRLGEQRPVVLVLEDLHHADAATRALVTFLARIAREQRLAIIGTHQPDVVGRDDPWTTDLGAIMTGPRPPERLTLPPLDRDELAALIEGIEGERASASLLLLVAERSGGLPLVAEELLAARRELPSASLTGSFDELVIARLADPLAECRRVLRLLSLAERPLGADQLAGGRRRVRGRHDPLRATLGDRTARGRRRARRRPVGRPQRGAGERVPRRDRRRDRVPPRVDRARRRARPAADRPDPLPRGPRGEPRRAAVGRGLALAGGHDPHAARSAAIEAAAFAGARHAAADELASLELALSLPDGPPPGGRGQATGGARRRTASTSRCVPRRRPSRSAGSRARRPISNRRSAASMPGATACRSVCSTSGWPRSAGPPAIRPGRCSPRGGRSSSSRASRVPSGRRSWPRSPSSRCSTASSPRRSASPATRSRSPARAIRSPAPRRSTPRRRSRSRSPGATTRQPRSSSCARRRRPRASSTTRMRSSGSGPT